MMYWEMAQPLDALVTDVLQGPGLPPGSVLMQHPVSGNWTGVSDV